MFLKTFHKGNDFPELIKQGKGKPKCTEIELLFLKVNVSAIDNSIIYNRQDMGNIGKL